MEIGEIIHVKVIDIAEGRKYLAKTDEGQVIFLDSALIATGDTVTAKITKKKRRVIEAKVVKIEEHASIRDIPRCDSFGYCGGCKFQHILYAHQLEFKQRKAADALEKIGNLQLPLGAIVPASKTYHYRNKIEFSFSDKRFVLENEGEDVSPTDFALGFHPTSIYTKVIDVSRCDIAPLGANDILWKVRSIAKKSGLLPYNTLSNEGFWRHLVLRFSKYQHGFMVNIVTSWHDERIMQVLKSELKLQTENTIITIVNSITSSKGNTSFGEECYVMEGDGFIYEKIGRFLFRISPNSFFQTNTEQAEVLYQLALREAELKKTDVVYDICCGAGTISMLLSDECEKVLGIDIAESAISDAMQAKSHHAVSNCEFERVDMKDLPKQIIHLERNFGKANVIMADPPRAGLHPKAIEAIRAIAPERIVYISCNPATLSRDAKEIVQDGKYKLVRMIPVDMFPQTNHVECVATFHKA